MRLTNSQKKQVVNSLEQLKGNIYKGIALEKYIGKMFGPFDSYKKNWKLSDNIVDCSYVDDASNNINEYYVHVEITDDTYTDILCIINNFEDDPKDWVILVKDVIRN